MRVAYNVVAMADVLMRAGGGRTLELATRAGALAVAEVVVSMTAAGGGTAGETAARGGTVGKTAAGETVAGETAAGETVAGETAAGECAVGEMAAGETAVGEWVVEEGAESREEGEGAVDSGGTSAKSGKLVACVPNALPRVSPSASNLTLSSTPLTKSGAMSIQLEVAYPKMCLRALRTNSVTSSLSSGSIPTLLACF